MIEITAQIREIVLAGAPEMLRISVYEAQRKTGPNDWSKKEILGHLIDSAANNLQRIVRGAQGAGLDFPPYDQNGWVAVQRYQEARWADLVDLFRLNNLNLCRVIDGLSEQQLENHCYVGKDHPVTVRFVIEDYLPHLKLHVEQILSRGM